MKLIQLVDISSTSSDSVVVGQPKLDNVYQNKKVKKPMLPKVKKSVYGIAHGDSVAADGGGSE